MTSVASHDIAQAVVFLGLIATFIVITWRTAK
jgi:hypothetical protein